MSIMRPIRWFLGKLILFWDRTFPAKPEIDRPPAVKAKISEQTRSMAIYQFKACPFCVKTRRAVRRMDLDIELRDASPGTHYAEELVREGGKLQVPCLKIIEGPGPARWMYESSEIIDYLAKKYSQHGDRRFDSN